MESKTIDTMVTMFCRDHHSRSDVPCSECADLRAYALQRLEKCPFGDGKPTCAKCPIHCYRPAMRERIREVMRYSGPRMLLQHPVLAIRHMLHERKAVPAMRKRRPEPSAPTA